jgi:hypothetical protein
MPADNMPADTLGGAEVALDAETYGQRMIF